MGWAAQPDRLDADGHFTGEEADAEPVIEQTKFQRVIESLNQL